VRRERVVAFAPGRVNLIGEHTDYNGGLALPFAIARGVTVRAEASAAALIEARAEDLDERDAFAPEDRSRAEGWRAFLRGTVAELSAAGVILRGARLQFGGDLPRGAGLSSSAALEVALCIALLALTDERDDRAPQRRSRLELARLCARVENDWVGAQTGLLDQLASLYGQQGMALCIDFATLEIEPVPLVLDGWRLVVLDSGDHHTHASSDYNDRRAECARACELLDISTLREATPQSIERLPQPLRRRAEHVLSENRRVRATVQALRAGDLAAVGALLSTSHTSLRDSYEISTPAVEATVQRMLDAGAAGARLTGGGFGGSVLGLFAPGARPPHEALEVRPSAGARLLDGEE
jgi:galactokinase